jgi:hypothetical protein
VYLDKMIGNYVTEKHVRGYILEQGQNRPSRVWRQENIDAPPAISCRENPGLRNVTGRGLRRNMRTAFGVKIFDRCMPAGSDAEHRRRTRKTQQNCGKSNDATPCARNGCFQIPVVHSHALYFLNDNGGHRYQQGENSLMALDRGLCGRSPFALCPMA